MKNITYHVEEVDVERLNEIKNDRIQKIREHKIKKIALMIGVIAEIAYEFKDVPLHVGIPEHFIHYQMFISVFSESLGTEDWIAGIQKSYEYYDNRHDESYLFLDFETNQKVKLYTPIYLMGKDDEVGVILDTENKFNLKIDQLIDKNDFDEVLDYLINMPDEIEAQLLSIYHEFKEGFDDDMNETSKKNDEKTVFHEILSGLDDTKSVIRPKVSMKWNKNLTYCGFGDFIQKLVEVKNE